MTMPVVLIKVNTVKQQHESTREITMQVTAHTELPPQSWLVKVCDNQVQGFSGANVELFNNGLVEGCWDGPFKEYGFRDAENFFGTGMVIEDNVVTFVAPTHTLEVLYLLNDGVSLIASNSLAFLLEFTGLNLPLSINYGKRFATMVQGIDQYEKTICDIDGTKLLRIAHTNVSWCDGNLTYSRKKKPPQFGEFDEYHNYLLSTLRKTFDNGTSQHRLQVWMPITSCSSGYDSTACAALAVSLGCNEALTLKNGQGGMDDSGLPVARALNLRVYEYHRNQKMDNTGFPEAEFFATGMGGEDFAYRAFEDRLHHKIFLTGFHGDKVWDINIKPNAIISRGDISGSSMTEWRLRVGFVLVSVPLIGFIRHHDIHRISLSDELANYRLNNTNYDRPVPRKIAEDMGVPRAAFGQSKKAASVLFCHSLRFMAPGSMQDLLGFQKEKFKGGALFYLQIRQSIYNARFATLKFSVKWLGKLFNTKLPLLWRLQSVWQMHGGSLEKMLSILIVSDYRVFEHSSPLKSDLPFLWSINRVKSRYRIDKQE